MEWCVVPFAAFVFLSGCTTSSPQDTPDTDDPLPAPPVPIEITNLSSAQDTSRIDAAPPESGILGDAVNYLPIPRPALPVVCARPAFSPIVAEVRDTQGEPAAIGAFVTIRSHTGFEATAKGFADSLQVMISQPIAGSIFDVEVSKPWHNSVVVRDVELIEDWCGIVEPVSVPVTLSLVPDAPPVRQVVAPPSSWSFGWGAMLDGVRAHVIAAPGVSREVVWVARDTTVIRMMPDGTFTTRCRTSRGSTWAVASSVVDPTKQDSLEIFVDADRDGRRCPDDSGHP